ncbi:CCA tRNA nucleotidyltransferase [Tuwongella immobilis]|uniref:Poly A polymerase head domain-containing protein n=1 Tax=Tuwongella immobilis TaxID=692036 RepID=A0A6C2YMY7_9BACT|nr:CCA tRNA nucleotidyltransferase [Tuwongella immobilis]VIP02968.1 trna adenylyltransferase : Metal dependent phosphohydrolase OS=Planctomyces maris DSM 8797 GN=PM8797T_01579 PE=3 SV=1: PolyA_pol: PolyA_pol_RNAbd [Tuwongella immobilis]VTS02992.1 trna adenylyltransferase : Metal dependent phosphohydrolase OS=Planctomyces maris DSM 8797 GN=PM8797T_01579 PE=3 SV=1: PolyA_pol: PolyA_pol_RNAbd [Tuwongella immobilis]
MTERDFSIQIIRRLRDAGFEAYWAGGCVRDHLLGRAPADYDVATSAEPAQVTPLFRHTLQIGAAFGVVQVVGPRIGDQPPLSCEVATFRTDGSYTDGRRPDSVRYCSAEEDAQRRDFTINGMFYDPIDGRLIDYVGGEADLQAKVLRAIGNPTARFTEDKLRLLRGIRMAMRFDLAIETETAAAIQQMASQIGVVSAERISDELHKIADHPRRAAGFQSLLEFGLLATIFPEFAESATDSDAWTEVIQSLQCLPRHASFPLVMASLFQLRTDAEVRRTAQRLRLSNEERDRWSWLHAHRSKLLDWQQLPLHQQKRLVVHPGFPELAQLVESHAAATGTSTDPVTAAQAMLATTPRERLDPPVLLTGDDLTAFGLKPGPMFKRLLDAIRVAQLDEEISTPEAAWDRIHTLLQSHS